MISQANADRRCVVEALGDAVSPLCQELEGEDLMDVVLELHHAYLTAKRIMVEKQSKPVRKYERKQNGQQS